jgi:hypothetical protein
LNRNKNKGFISILIVFTLLIIGLYTIVLAGITSTIQHQSNQMLLDAKNFNLQQSALAFVKSRGQIKESVQIQLDDDLFKNCSVNIVRENNSITINTRCSIGRQKETNSYNIPVGKRR